MISDLDMPVRMLITGGFGLVLIAILGRLSYIDIKTFRLPNALTFPLIGFGVFQAFIINGHWIDAVIGAFAGYAILVAVEYGFRALRGKDGIGRGDAKLLAAGGAWCGGLALPYILLCASLSGILFALWRAVKAQSAPEIESDTLVPKDWIPFGPFLAWGILAVWAAQQIARL